METKNKRYPKISIRSKNELAKHLSHKGFSVKEALALINDVLGNFDSYWKDSRASSPEKQKYVRTAKGTKLGILLDKINTSVLAPHDCMLPDFIFGSIKGKNHAMAAKHLLGQKRKRTLLCLDIKQFFEQISNERVEQFFLSKCKCDRRTAKLLAKLCCVSIGPKGSGSDKKSIARGFATSPRLSVWCNLDLFIKLEWVVKKRLKGKDARVMIYVDDIGIMAALTNKETLEELYSEITKLFEESDPNHTLHLHPLGTKKSRIISHEENPRILGLALHRNKLKVGGKTKSKIAKTKNDLKKTLQNTERERIKRRRKSLGYYKDYIERLNLKV